nr:SpoIIE family protein phosphatase [Streptacidiphilus neutrinimicus]
MHQAQLEPGDRILIHTDGVTEARSGTGQLFGEAQLVDFITRALAAGEPAPEALRRLIHTILGHHTGASRTTPPSSWPNGTPPTAAPDRPASSPVRAGREGPRSVAVGGLVPWRGCGGHVPVGGHAGAAAGAAGRSGAGCPRRRRVPCGTSRPDDAAARHDVPQVHLAADGLGAVLGPQFVSEHDRLRGPVRRARPGPLPRRLPGPSQPMPQVPNLGGHVPGARAARRVHGRLLPGGTGHRPMGPV